VQLCEESLALFRALGEERGVAHNLAYLGGVARATGDLARALALCQEGLALCWQLGERSRIVASIEDLAGVAHSLGQAAAAARLFGAAAALRERTGVPVPPADRDNQARLVAAVREALGPGFAVAWREGQAVALDQIVNDALALEPAIVTA
jgi:hypothetical protein